MTIALILVKAGFRTFHYVSFIYGFFFSFRFLLFRFFSRCFLFFFLCLHFVFSVFYVSQFTGTHIVRIKLPEPSA